MKKIILTLFVLICLQANGQSFLWNFKKAKLDSMINAANDSLEMQTNRLRTMQTNLSSSINSLRTRFANDSVLIWSANNTKASTSLTTALKHSIDSLSAALNSKAMTPGPQGIQGIQGPIGPAGTYTSGTGISISGGVITNTAIPTVTMAQLNGKADSVTVGLLSRLPQIVFLPNITISETAVIAIAAGPRNIPVSCTGIMAGDRVVVVPTSAPAGYMVGSAVATATNTIVVQVNAPLLAVGASYSITCKVSVFR